MAAARAGAREWIGLGVIALPCVLYSMDLTVLNLALPAISADLHPTATQLLWIVDIYGFLVAGALITMGTVGDRIGRRRLLMIGAGAFGAGSVLAACSTSAEMLIATRALLGIAGATLAPSTLSLIRNMFHDSHQRTLAIGVWITSYSVGAAIGPLLGGLLLEQFHWGSVFLINVPIMALLLAIGPVLLPEFRDPDAARVDLPSAALSLSAVLAVVYGIKQTAEHGAAWLPAFAIAAGVIAGALFLRRQRSLATPFLDVALFRLPSFSAALVTYMLGCFAIFGIYIFIAQYLQLVLALSPLQAGLWTVPWALGFVLGSLLAPLAVRRFPPPLVIAAGQALAIAGFLILTQVRGSYALAILVTGSCLLSIGMAPVFTLATDLIVGAAPPERAGSAAAISETGSELGGALGIAVLGSIATAVHGSLASADSLAGGIALISAIGALIVLGTLVGTMTLARRAVPSQASLRQNH
jgi:MFS transporter, DHA2 family, multidrug resistance protein